MYDSRVPKSIKISFLITAFSFLFWLPTTANAGKIRNKATKNATTIIQKIKKFCRQYSTKKNKKNNTLENLDNQKVHQLQQTEADHSSSMPTQKNQTKYASNNAVLNQSMTPPIETTADDEKSDIVLDAYETIKDLYAYDPIGRAWVRIKSFKIISSPRNDQPIDATFDRKPYIKFWAYDLSNQTWHKVSLIPYLQQANTQINSDSVAIATKESVLSTHNNPLHDLATDELLEELLGVHTFIKPSNPEQKESIWANFSLDFSIGAGAVFYRNRLEQMRVCQRQRHDYFFITKTNEVYKPNWFHDTLSTLNQKTDFYESNDIERGGSDNASFQGKGWGMPITLGIQYIFWQQLLVGVGREIVFNATNKLVHNDGAIKHKAYIIDKKWSTQGRWFAKCGWYPFNNKTHRFFGDIRLCYVHHLGGIFPRLVTFGLYLHQALAYNLGVGYEQQLTDYLSSTTRLSIELQRFKQFSNKKAYDYNIQYTQPAIYLQVGLSVRCAKYNAANNFKNREYQNKNNRLNNLSKLEGLQNLLDLD